jgi:hypothetical protein
MAAWMFISRYSCTRCRSSMGARSYDCGMVRRGGGAKRILKAGFVEDYKPAIAAKCS